MGTSKHLTKKKYRLSSDAVSQEVCGELVILNLKQERYFGLNDVGASIWAGLAEGRSMGEILRAVTENYEVGYEQAQIDLEELLGQFFDAGLVIEESP